MPSAIIIVEENCGFDRVNEPVTLGIPFPRGLLVDDAELALQDEAGELAALQTKVVDRWSDGSCRWILVDFQATVRAGHSESYNLQPMREKSPMIGPHAVQIGHFCEMIRVDTGVATFFLDQLVLRPFSRVVVNSREILGTGSNDTVLTDTKGQPWEPRIEKISVETVGPLRSTILFEGSFRRPEKRRPHALFFARIHFFAGYPLAKCEFTLRNANAAKHAGGLWDLGDPGSIYFHDLSLHTQLHNKNADTLAWREQPEAELKTTQEPYVEIYQDSSGGENWQSRNHVNRFGKVMNTFRGYRVRTSEIVSTGYRAQPSLMISGSQGGVAVAIRSFWQNFPKALEADRGKLTVRLFPRQYNDVFELQGGEQKTHTIYFYFSSPLEHKDLPGWVHVPLIPTPKPQWYVASKVFPYMIAETSDHNVQYLNLVCCAVDGENNFFQRREIIDEYGWRHFGDLYADHEATYYRGPKPIISHYNNQYDAIEAFALHYARTGDSQWFMLMLDLAKHVIDIDIYHTLEDKPAYSGGLFWHTDHYTDAETSSHRSFSKRTTERRKLKDYGGGPCNEHLYTTGLMSYYFITGDTQAREAVITLADWVVRMDDGTLTPLRFLSEVGTGLASQTTGRDYHGPGRGAANSINALLDAYRLTRRQEYLAKAEELVRRCIHPTDSIDSIGLGDVERRWSYLVFLQVLGKYLDCKVEWDQLDSMFHYARQSLLHYARWIVDREVPYSQVLAKVEYPTETWVVHDLRKTNVLEWAAFYSSDAEREQFFKKANFFYENCFDELKRYTTTTFTRPLVLVLRYGHMHSYFQSHGSQLWIDWRQDSAELPFPELFVPQRRIVEKRLKLLGGVSGALMITLLGFVLLHAR